MRGGTHTPVDKQMLRAIEQFFPEDVESEALPRASTDSRSHGLHRVNTGVSSIVGAENGDRPGGFVLVVDGAALLHVSYGTVFVMFSLIKRQFSRHLRTKTTRRFCFGLGPFARA